MSKQRNHPEQLAAAQRGRALYIRLYDKATAELAQAKADLQEERIKHAKTQTTLANVAHAIESGISPDLTLPLIRLALRIGNGGQPS